MNDPLRPRFRIAPSPTGYFHVGGARTALYNWALAKRLGGTFVLRIEDTDAERNRPEWNQGIVDALAWIGIHADDPTFEGPYFQSQYAAQHVRKTEKGTTVCWIDENLNPDTGEWIAREIILRQKRGPLERGKDYNHSTYCDLVIAGLVGIVPQDGDKLVVDPLFPKEWDYLGLENVRYHGHDVSVRWDRTGGRYGMKGFVVFVDGKPAARAPSPARLGITLPGMK